MFYDFKMKLIFQLGITKLKKYFLSPVYLAFIQIKIKTCLKQQKNTTSQFYTNIQYVNKQNVF